jgi:hypothetical protein
VFSKIPIT